MRRHIKYLSYVLRHKWFVFVAGIKLGVPLHQLILHDWTKFMPGEWKAYAATFRTADGKKIYAIERPEFRMALLNHVHTHKHHWQRWILTHGGKSECLPMPDRFRREMLADWHGAGRALGQPNTAAWYVTNAADMELHPDTRDWIEEQLGLRG